MNKEVMFSSKTDLWETPQDFFEKLDREFGFELDVCALPENAKCSRYFSPMDDGLEQDWTGVCWCNPPYGREIEKWVKRLTYLPSKVRRLLCCSQHGQIRDGSTIGFTGKRKFALFVAD